MEQAFGICLIVALPLGFLAVTLMVAQHYVRQRSVWLRKRAEVLASAISLHGSIDRSICQVANGEGGAVSVEPTNALVAIRGELSYMIECLRFSKPSGIDLLLDRHMGTMTRFERRIDELQVLMGPEADSRPPATCPGGPEER